jgi:hypothetical protein
MHSQNASCKIVYLCKKIHSLLDVADLIFAFFFRIVGINTFFNLRGRFSGITRFDLRVKQSARAGKRSRDRQTDRHTYCCRSVEGRHKVRGGVNTRQRHPCFFFLANRCRSDWHFSRVIIHVVFHFHWTFGSNWEWKTPIHIPGCHSAQEAAAGSHCWCDRSKRSWERG